MADQQELPDQTYPIPPEEWPDLLTDDLKAHFERVGEASVQFDLSNHKYGETQKQFAALHWLGLKRKRRQRITYMILTIAATTLAVSLWPYVEPEETVEGASFEGFSIVEEQHIHCFARVAESNGIDVIFTKRLVNGIDVIFTKRLVNGEEEWLADGMPIVGPLIEGNVLSGEATYYEMVQSDDTLSLTYPIGEISLLYRFRLDFVKGKFDVFVPPVDRDTENTGALYKGICEPHETTLR